MSNRITLDQLDQMPIGEIANLDVEQLAMLAEDAEELVQRAKRLKDWIGSAVDIRYGEASKSLRSGKGKTTGTVRVQDGEYEVVCNLPKKPEWDQAKLRQALATIESWGSDPREYVDLVIKVSERAYEAWPSEIRKVFEPARTLKTGKPTYKFQRREAA